MENPAKLIHKFNKEANLLTGYNPKLEASLAIEEQLEGFNLEILAHKLGINDTSPKAVAREIASLATQNIELYEPLPEVNILDKHLDSIVVNQGSIYKMGLTPQEYTHALTIVATANMQKIKAGQDSNGKQLKPANFIPPEAKLQKLLDKAHKRMEAEN